MEKEKLISCLAAKKKGGGQQREVVLDASLCLLVPVEQEQSWRKETALTDPEGRQSREHLPGSCSCSRP